MREMRTTMRMRHPKWRRPGYGLDEGTTKRPFFLAVIGVALERNRNEDRVFLPPVLSNQSSVL
jgi:hypothetical protein